MAALLSSSPVFAQLLLSPEEGQYRLSSDISYFSTSKNFNGDGTTQDLPFENELQLVQGNLFGVYDLNSSWRFSLGLQGGWIETVGIDFERTNAGVSEVFAGSQYWLTLSAFHLVPYVNFVFPTFRTDVNDDAAFFGEGAIRLRTGLQAILPLGSFYPFVDMSFEYRDEGRSSLLPYAAGVQFDSNSFFMNGQFRGFFSVIDDEDTNQPQRRNLYLSRVNAQSARFYSFNPSGHEFFTEAGFRFSQIELKGGVSYVFAGENFSQGWTFLVGLTYRGGGESYRDVEKEKRGYQEKFVPEKTEYDENLFKEMPEPEKQPKESVRKIRKKVRQKPKVDTLLNDTEKNLEKRN